MPLFKDAPFAEALEAARRIPDGVDLSDGALKAILAGIRSATSHVTDDYGQLGTFRQEWDSGLYFVTRRGIRNLAARTYAIWHDADKYLEISWRLNMTRVRSCGQEHLLMSQADNLLGESALNLATRIMKQFKPFFRYCN